MRGYGAVDYSIEFYLRANKKFEELFSLTQVLSRARSSSAYIYFWYQTTYVIVSDWGFWFSLRIGTN